MTNKVIRSTLPNFLSKPITIAEAKIVKDRFKPTREYRLIAGFFFDFLKDVKKQTIPDYTTGLGMRIGKVDSSDILNIGLETIFYKKPMNSITNYRTLKTNFFGRLVTDFDNPISDQRTFQNNLAIPDNRSSTTDPIKIGPARIAIIELDQLEDYQKDINYDREKDFICFALGRAEDERVTVVISFKKSILGATRLIKPKTNPDYAYFDVHDLIPPPPEEDESK